MGLTRERLTELLYYNQDTGDFTWKFSRVGVRAGSRAGGKNYAGYVIIRLDDKLYYAHRLAFLYVVGYMPEYDVDHLDGNPCNNKWGNLRHASRMCNLQNRKVSTTNRSGFPGVSQDKTGGAYRAGITLEGRNLNLGRYPTALEAALARYTFESQCDKWRCDHRSKLVMAISKAWPDFCLQSQDIT